MQQPYKLRSVAFFAALCIATTTAVPLLAQTSRRVNNVKPAPKMEKAMDSMKDMDGKTIQKGEPLGTISFKASNQRHDNEGSFKSWRFTEISKPASGLEGGTATIEVDLTSLSAKQQSESSENSKLTGHLKSADFFNVEKNATATISIEDIKKSSTTKGVGGLVDKAKDAVLEKDEGAEYSATGSIEIGGMSAPLTLDFDVVQKDPLKIKGTAKVDRDKLAVGKPYEEGGIQQHVDIEFETLVPDEVVAVDAASAGESVRTKVDRMKNNAGEMKNDATDLKNKLMKKSDSK